MQPHRFASKCHHGEDSSLTHRDLNVFMSNALDQVAVERVSVPKAPSQLAAALVTVQTAAWTPCLAEAHQAWCHWVLKAESGICLHPLLCAFPCVRHSCEGRTPFPKVSSPSRLRHPLAITHTSLSCRDGYREAPLRLWALRQKLRPLPMQLNYIQRGAWLSAWLGRSLAVPTSIPRCL